MIDTHESSSCDRLMTPAPLAHITSVHGLPLPLSLAKTPRSRVANHEATYPGQGMSASYINAVYSVTLYIYDSGFTDMPDDPVSEVVVEHFRAAIQGAIAAAQARNETLRCKAAHAVAEPPATTAEYLVAKFGTDDDNGRFTSFIYLAVKNGKFVKLRITFSQPSISAESLAEVVANSYFALLWPGRVIVGRTAVSD